MPNDRSSGRKAPARRRAPMSISVVVPNFSDITGVYPEDLGKTMITGPVKGEQIKIKGTVLRWHRHRAQRCYAGDLAGRCRRHLPGQ